MHHPSTVSHILHSNLSRGRVTIQSLTCLKHGIKRYIPVRTMYVLKSYWHVLCSEHLSDASKSLLYAGSPLAELSPSFQQSAQLTHHPSASCLFQIVTASGLPHTHCCSHIKAWFWGGFIQLSHPSMLHRPTGGQFQLLKGDEVDQVVTEVLFGTMGSLMVL